MDFSLYNFRVKIDQDQILEDLARFLGLGEDEKYLRLNYNLLEVSIHLKNMYLKLNFRNQNLKKNEFKFNFTYFDIFS